MSTNTASIDTLATISERFKSIGLTTTAFLSCTLTPAELQGYLTSVAPYEPQMNAQQQAVWDQALVKNTLMMKTGGQKPLVI